MSGITTLIFVAVVMFCILGGVTLLAHIYNLNSIKSKTVGDGQHGTARWATKSEIRKIYNHIPFTPEKWREQAANGETPTVNDCCCGAGCLLIAFANEARKAGIDFQRRVVFIAQDIDHTAALMCYIQLSLLGCKAVVKIGNSLTDPFVAQEPKSEKLWFTPMYLYGDVFRIMSILESIELNKEVTPNGEEKDNRENKSA